MDNHDIVKTAQECLRNHSYAPIRLVECSIEEGELILRGTLPTFYMKSLAFHAVQGRVNGTAINVGLLRVVRHDATEDPS